MGNTYVINPPIENLVLAKEREARYSLKLAGTRRHQIKHSARTFNRKPLWHILAYLYASAGGRRAAQRPTSRCICGRAAGGKAIHISMHLRAGGGRHNDPHLYASAGGRRAAKRSTSRSICRRAAGGKTTHIHIHLWTGGHLEAMSGPSWAILRHFEPS